MKKTLALLSLAALAGLTVAAQACPRGQILRVSKNVCVDREEAIKLGILRGDKAKPAKADAAKAVPEPEAASPEIARPEPQNAVAPAPTPVKTEYVPPAPPAQPAADLEMSRPPVAAVRRVGAAPREPAPLKAEAPTASPFGALDPGGVPMSQPR